MPLCFKTVGLTAHSDIDKREQTILHLARIVESTGATLLLDGKRCHVPQWKSAKTYRSIADIDLLLVVGGDGTILRVVREMDDFSVPLLSVNRGTLGFLTEISIGEARKAIPQFLMGKGTIEPRSLLEITAKRGTLTLLSGRVLNEAVISQGAISRLIDLKTSINGKSLATFHADGVIIATPTGSTAYSLAAGGPIVHPELRATILTPINPYSFSQKPIVLPAEDVVDVTIMTKPNKFQDVEVSLTLDGQRYVSLKRGDTVSASIASEAALFLRRKKDMFFDTIRDKLKWGERLQNE